MKRTLPLILLLFLVTITMCKKNEVVIDYPTTILMDPIHLATTKAAIKSGDATYKPAFNQLIVEAEAALKEGPFSVTDKEKLAPSGDIHDYASYSRYWWPDPKTTDGLPYIRRDGETNPDSQSLTKSDRQRLGTFAEHTETLGLAYYFTGEEKYAEKAASLLRVWFIDSATLMHPNLNHAQCRPGHNEGTKSGVLDGRLIIKALEGAQLISKSGALSSKEYSALKAWSNAYLKWLTTNEMALEEAASLNNHGSFYDVQALYFALYADNRKTATHIAQRFAHKRVLSQIQLNGTMPEEMARTRSLFYSIYNLHAMFTVAHLAKRVDIDLWKVGHKDSRLRLALDYLAPYADENRSWPIPTIGEADRMELLAIFQMANDGYPKGNYLKFIESLPLERRQIQRTNLAYPLMR